MKFWKLVPLTGVLMLGLSGCFLLPEEAAVPSLPLVTPYSGEEYLTAEVTLGDLELTKELNCSYLATNREELRFGVARQPYAAVYVEAGQQVEAGQLLAELDTAQVSEKLRAAETEVARLEVMLAAEEKALSLARESMHLTGGSDVSVQARESSVEYYRASLEIQRQKRAELAAELESLRLYSSMDGTVTFAKTLKEGELSSTAETVVVVTDTASSVFSADTELWELLPEGTEVSVSAEGVDYPCRVVSPESLGLPGEEADSRNRKTVYLEIQGPEMPTGNNVRGKAVLLLDSRRQVLLLPARAVFTVGDRAYVYREDESGIKTAQEISCGLSNSRFVEVTDGLSQGDVVILG